MKRPKSHERLAGKGRRFTTYRRGERVEVFTGMGWKKGTVVDTRTDRISVRLDGDDSGFPRQTYDPRNCLPLK